jgi:hypothetical protein
MKYFKPKSLSWWSAVVYGAVAIARGIGVEIPVQVDGILAALFGVGIRGKIGEK